MKSPESQDTETRGLIERGLKWDIGFNRKLGIAALAGAGLFAIAGSPVVGAKIAMFAGASFAAAEVEARAVRSFEKRRKTQ